MADCRKVLTAYAASEEHNRSVNEDAVGEGKPGGGGGVLPEHGWGRDGEGKKPEIRNPKSERRPRPEIRRGFGFGDKLVANRYYSWFGGFNAKTQRYWRTAFKDAKREKPLGGL